MSTKQTIAITHSRAYIILTWSGGDVKRIPKKNLTIIYRDDLNIDDTKVYLNWPAGDYPQAKDHQEVDYTDVSSPTVASNAALAVILQAYADEGGDLVITETLLASIDSDQSDIQEATRREVGYFGSDTYGDALTHTGAWFALRVDTAAEIDAITDVCTGPVSTIPLATAIAAGAYLSAAGRFTSITLGEGMVTLYRILLFTTTTSTTTTTGI